MKIAKLETFASPYVCFVRVTAAWDLRGRVSGKPVASLPGSGLARVRAMPVR